MSARVTRRTLTQGAAWAVPAVTATSVVPAFASSTCATASGAQGGFTRSSGTAASTSTGNANWRQPTATPFNGTTWAAVVDIDNATASTSTSGYLVYRTTYTLTGLTPGHTYTYSMNIYGRYGNNCQAVSYSQSAVITGTNGTTTTQLGYYNTRTPTVAMPTGAATGSATTLPASPGACVANTGWGSAQALSVSFTPTTSSYTFTFTYYVQPRNCGNYNVSGGTYTLCQGTNTTSSDDIAITQPAFVSCV